MKITPIQGGVLAIAAVLAITALVIVSVSMNLSPDLPMWLALIPGGLAILLAALALLTGGKS